MADSQDALQFSASDFGYLAFSEPQQPSDDLAIELYSGIGEATDREITDENYATCDPCVLLRFNCDEDLGTCDQRFLATSGTIEIDTFSGDFVGTLRDAVLVEVTIEGITSTPVPDGEVICLDDYAFDAVIQTGD